MLLKSLPILLALLGTPLFIVIAALALLAFHSIEIDSSVIIIEMTRLSDTPLLLSLPLFIFAGSILSESNTPKRLLNLSSSVFGWFPGGLAVIALVVCAFFTAFTGASGITIFALGGLLYPALLADNYDERFSLGLITTSGSLGLLFPPSLPLILYGVIAGARIDKLFIAGIVPGSIMLLMLACYSSYKGLAKKPTAPENKRGVWQHIKEAKWELPLPVIILGGIYGGILVVSEAAAVTALYVLIIEVCIYRDIAIRDLPSIMIRSMMLFGGILIVLAASMATTNYIIDQEIPSLLFDTISNYISSKYSFLLALNIFLLAVGFFLDIFSALVLIVPIIVPIAVSYEVNLIHLGIVFLTNLQIGYCTPPVGLNLFLASYKFNKPIWEIYRSTLPFLVLLLLFLLLITYIPSLSLILPEIVSG